MNDKSTKIIHFTLRIMGSPKLVGFGDPTKPCQKQIQTPPFGGSQWFLGQWSFLCSPFPGEMIQFDSYFIRWVGPWFNHHLENHPYFGEFFWCPARSSGFQFLGWLHESLHLGLQSCISGFLFSRALLLGCLGCDIGGAKEPGVIYFSTNWGAKEPQNLPNHRVVFFLVHR